MSNPKPTKETGPRINNQIIAREIRVIDPEGGQLGVLTVNEALAKAESFSLDLVEVAPQAKPPVCRIMDFGKYKYQQKKRQAEARKNQVTISIKEVKFRPKIEDHDYGFKVRNIRKFLEEGNKAKVTMMFRGREMAHTERGRELLNKILAELGDAAVLEQTPKLEGRNMTMVIAPGKGAAKPAAKPASADVKPAAKPASPVAKPDAKPATGGPAAAPHPVAAKPPASTITPTPAQPD